MFLTKPLLIILTFSFGFSAKILCVFFTPSFSHQITLSPISKELSLRGHQVTAITPNPLNDPFLENLTEIDVSFVYDIVKDVAPEKILNLQNNRFRLISIIMEKGIDIIETLLKHRSIRDLIDDKNNRFDLIVFQNSHVHNLVLGFVGRFGCPSVGVSSMGLFLHSHDAIGNPTHPLISPDVLLNIDQEEMTFFDRIDSFLYNIWYRLFYYWYALPKADSVARKYFGQDLPYLGDVEKNISLMMVNVNPLLHPVRATVPNLIEINLMHIRKKKQPLPQDIQDYLDDSPQGVVYFSLGSNIKSANLTSKMKQEILDCFKDLPYNVLWKFEDESLAEISSNVLTKKWLPQQDVLAHPNVKAFITQGGLQSIEESIINEKPMIGIPFIIDQPINIDKIVKLGMGLKIDYETLNKNDLKEAIVKVVGNEIYKKAVQKGKSILEDQPIIGVEKAIWWIEYVLRHKGAKHLRSRAADMSFFQYFMIDVATFLLISIFTFFYVLYKLIKIKICKSVKKFKQQ